MVDFLGSLAGGCKALDLHRVFGYCLARNPASARVMEKSGMQREGLLRQHIFRFGRFEDIVMLGVVRGD